MAGIRLGICYASKEIISVLNKIKPPYNINAINSRKGFRTLSKPAEVSEEIEQYFKRTGKAYIQN